MLPARITIPQPGKTDDSVIRESIFWCICKQTGDGVARVVAKNRHIGRRLRAGQPTCQVAGPPDRSPDPAFRH